MPFSAFGSIFLVGVESEMGCFMGCEFPTGNIVFLQASANIRGRERDFGCLILRSHVFGAFSIFRACGQMITFDNIFSVLSWSILPLLVGLELS